MDWIRQLNCNRKLDASFQFITINIRSALHLCALRFGEHSLNTVFIVWTLTMATRTFFNIYWNCVEESIHCIVRISEIFSWMWTSRCMMVVFDGNFVCTRRNRPSQRWLSLVSNKMEIAFRQQNPQASIFAFHLLNKITRCAGSLFDTGWALSIVYAKCKLFAVVVASKIAFPLNDHAHHFAMRCRFAAWGCGGWLVCRWKFLWTAKQQLAFVLRCDAKCQLKGTMIFIFKFCII